MQGYLPLADLVCMRAGLASIGNDVLAEKFPQPQQGGEGVLRSVYAAMLRIPDPPLSQGPVRVLRDPAAQSHSRFYSAHLGFCRSL